MPYQNKVAVSVGASLSAGSVIGEQRIDGRYKASMNQACYLRTAEAPLQRNSVPVCRTRAIQENVSASGSTDARRNYPTRSHGEAEVSTIHPNTSLSSKPTAQTFEVIFCIHGHRAGDEVIEAAVSIFEMALSIERDVETIAHWYCFDPIASLGGQSSLQLVETGQNLKVIEFLESIKNFEADQLNSQPMRWVVLS